MRPTLFVVSMLVAGCTTGQVSSPPTTPSSTSSTADPTSAPPPVSKMYLSVDRFKDKPCDILTPEELTSFAIAGRGTSVNANQTPDCLWDAPEDPDGNTGVGIILWTGRDLKAAAYPKLKSHSFFIPGTVSGYPSVDLNFDIDINPWKCMTFVGISETQSITASVKNLRAGDYCPRTHQIAEAVLAHLRKP